MSTPIAHALAGIAVLEASRRVGRDNIHAGWKWAVACVLIACLPDIDNPLVRLFGHGVDFLNVAGGWGPRRGLTHTLLFAFVAALGFSAVLSARGALSGRTFARHTALFFFAAAAHPLIDVVTHAGDGIPFFWPLSDTRFRFPWPLLPVVPYQSRHFGVGGLFANPWVYFALAMEIVIMGSILLAIRSRRPRGALPWVAGAGAGMFCVFAARMGIFR